MNKLGTIGFSLILILSGGFGGVVIADSSQRSLMNGDVIVVAKDGSGDYASIDIAINQASAGDEIRVLPGTYEEQVTIDKTITINASNEAVLNGDGLGSDLSGVTSPINSNIDVIIRGLTIKNFHQGIYVNGVTGDWTLQNLTIIQNKDTDLLTEGGIETFNTAGEWIIFNTTIKHNEIGIIAEAASGSWRINQSKIESNSELAVDGSNSAEWVIHNTTVTDNGGGIDISNAGGPVTVTNTKITENEDSDLLTEGGLNVNSVTNSIYIRNSRISGNDIGIQGNGLSGGITVQNSTVSHNNGGIDIPNVGGPVTITNSAIIQNADSDLVSDGGLNVDSGADSINISNTTISGNDVGIQGYGLIGSVTIQESTISNNDENGIDAANANEWTVVDSKITDNGGGVNLENSDGEITIWNSTIDDNHDSDLLTEPGLDVSGVRTNVSVQNVSLDQNDLGVDSAGTTGTVLIEDSTISNNDGKAIEAPNAENIRLLNTPVRQNGGGIDISSNSGDVVVQNSPIANNRDSDLLTEYGLNLNDLTGRIVVRNSPIENGEGGIMAEYASGKITIIESPIRDNENLGIAGSQIAGELIIRRSDIEQNGGGLQFTDASAAIEIRRSVITNNKDSDFFTEPGIDVELFSGALSIWNSTLSNNENDGLDAEDSTGTISIGYTNIMGNEEHDIDGDSSVEIINASHNWWGQPDGPSPGQCIGNVICNDPLASPAQLNKDKTVSNESTIASFSETEALVWDQTTPDNLADALRVERSVVTHVSVDLLRNTSKNYSVAITGPDEAENVTVLIQEQAIRTSWTFSNLTMYLDGEEHPFTVVKSAGAENHSWAAFNMPTLSARTISFKNETDMSPCIADIVAGTDGRIGLTEIQEAINWWAEDSPVPDTGSKTISLSKIQSLINAWAEGSPVSCS